LNRNFNGEKTTNKKENIVDPKERVIQKLVLQGKKQGYLTVTEVLSIFPEAEENIEDIDKLYKKLGDESINVFDVESEKGEGDLDAFSEGILDKLKSSGSRSTDPVRMYLREIGKVDLLTAEEEVRLAKAIEGGDEKSFEYLTRANLRLVVSIAKKYMGERPCFLGFDSRGKYWII